MTRFLTAFAVVLAMCATALTLAAFAESPTDHPPHVERPKAGATAALPLAATGGADITAALSHFTEGIMREQERIAAEQMAAMEAARPRSGSGVAAPRARAGVGDCTGFAIPDDIIWRESRGDPYAVNPSSGAFGCAQVMPFHWAPGGACADLDRYDLDDQRTCVDWLSRGGTRLSPWGG